MEIFNTIKQPSLDLDAIKTFTSFHIKDEGLWRAIHYACFPEYNKTSFRTIKTYSWQSDYDPEEIYKTKKYGRMEFIKFLIDKGVNVNAKTKEGYTPLGILFWNFNYKNLHKFKEIATLLFDNGANVNAIDIFGVNPLMYIVQYIKDADYIKKILPRANILTFDNKGKSVFRYANPFIYLLLKPIFDKKIEYYEELLKKEQDKYAKKYDEKILRKIEYFNEIINILRIELTEGIDEFKTKNFDEEFEKETIKEKVLYYKQEEEGNKYWDKVNEAYRKKLKVIRDGITEIKFLDKEKVKMKYTVFLYACRFFPDQESLNVMIPKVKKFDFKDEDGNVCLHYLMRTGYISEIKEVLKKKNMINLQNKKGVTPFHLACQFITDVDFIKTLKHFYNADESIIDNNNNNILHYAAFTKNDKVYKILQNEDIFDIGFGTSHHFLNDANNDGYTPQELMEEK